jgi:hypothetical protein
LPKWLPGVVGRAKTELDVQDPATAGLHTPVEYHCSGRPTTSIVPTRSGRMLALPLKFRFVMMLIGFPVCPWVMTAICHPSLSWFPLKGRSQMAFST